jgi:protoheme IX farnesyltransferase
MLLVLITGATALILEGSFLAEPVKFVLFLAGLYLTGGSANAFNQYFERDLDARMSRTMRRRPLPTGRISAPGALFFAAGIGIAGVALLAGVFNLLTASLSLVTLLFYSLFYTLWLKPHTPLNIVIGGAAGAMAPVGAWAAATGSTTFTPWILFLVVFLWTPPHFWSLALHFQDDYRQSGYPMLPIVKGEKAAIRQIELYSYALTVASLAYLLTGGGWIYGIGAIGLGAGFVVKVAALKRGTDRRSPWALFSYSIVYLFGLFAVMIIDKFAERAL